MKTVSKRISLHFPHLQESTRFFRIAQSLTDKPNFDLITNPLILGNHLEKKNQTETINVKMPRCLGTKKVKDNRFKYQNIMKQ